MFSSKLVLLWRVAPSLLLLPAFRLMLICPWLLFFCWVSEAGLGVVETLLPEEPEPKPDIVEEARWREVGAF